MASELVPALVHDRALVRGQAVAREEVAVVAPGEEAGLLAFGTRRGLEPGGGCLRTRLVLRLLAERKPEAVEKAWIETSEHVRLILGRSCAAA